MKFKNHQTNIVFLITKLQNGVFRLGNHSTCAACYQYRLKGLAQVSPRLYRDVLVHRELRGGDPTQFFVFRCVLQLLPGEAFVHSSSCTSNVNREGKRKRERKTERERERDIFAEISLYMWQHMQRNFK